MTTGVFSKDTVTSGTFTVATSTPSTAAAATPKFKQTNPRQFKEFGIKVKATYLQCPRPVQQKPESDLGGDLMSSTSGWDLNDDRMLYNEHNQKKNLFSLDVRDNEVNAADVVANARMIQQISFVMLNCVE